MRSYCIRALLFAAVEAMRSYFKFRALSSSSAMITYSFEVDEEMLSPREAVKTIVCFVAFCYLISHRQTRNIYTTQ